MPRDHTRINLDIWGDDEFRELPVDAQALYWTLWTSPARTYCGAHEWRPGKLTQTAGDWTVDRVKAAGAVLSERLFLVIDETTEECLLRSWIKHDGLWKVPNMAVSMAMARAAVASRVLRGVVVHEVKKLVAADPKLSSWERDEVQKMLAQKAVDPADLEPFNPGPNPGGNPLPNPPAKGYEQNGVNPPANPPPTTATSTTTSYGYIRGDVLGDTYLSGASEPPRCPRHHTNGNPNDDPCRKCRAVRDWVTAQEAAKAADEVNRQRQKRLTDAQRLKACGDCDEDGWRYDDREIKCRHQKVRHA